MDVADTVSFWLRGAGGLSFTFGAGSALAGLRGGRAVLDPPKPQDRAIDGPAV
jgi:hypothetical protein